MPGQHTPGGPADGDGHWGIPPGPVVDGAGAALGESKEEYEKVVGGPT